MVPQLTQGDLHHKDAVIFWLTISLLVVSVVFLATIVSLTIRCLIRRHARYQEVGRPDGQEPQPTKTMRSCWGLGRSQTLEDRVEQEELQREYMIRKTYATRASLRASSQLSNYSSDVDVEAVPEDVRAAHPRDASRDREAKVPGGQRRSPDVRPTIIHPLDVEIDLGDCNASSNEEPSPVPRHGLFALPPRGSTTTRFNLAH